ncbi:MAG: CRISPR-associated endonuclease Cas2 [Clostridiales bacterium]|jgi:CRISPR-associated protein Cas2|nr:CRISPR-associated endonuclease Cas2 [Clostridiales bacterium]
MFVLITYDVNTETPAGRKRLRQISKICVNYGQRVQNSVFECNIDSALFRKVREQIENTMDSELDSIRYYFLGKNYDAKVEHIGSKPTPNPNNPLIF